MRALRWMLGWLVCGVVAAGALEAGGAEQKPAKLRVLLLSGRNNHDWKTTTPALVKLYEASGRFAVQVTDEPAKCTPESFSRCDVVVSNWTPWPDVKQRAWDDKTEAAFLAFIRGGRGLVVFHASSTAMQSWPEFQKIVGATWGLSQTGHGPRHEFDVVIADKKHPVTAGMADFRILDELWHRMPLQEGVKVLCTAMSAKDKGGSGQVEPVALVTQFGEGRGLNLILGHDTKAMACPSWQALMLRGTEWAATGKVTPPAVAPATAPAAGAAGAAGAQGPTAPPADEDAALRAVAAWQFGQSRKPLVAVERIASAAAAGPAEGRAKLAAKLAAMLKSDTTPDCRRFLCGQVGLIGGDAEVPAVAALLTDPEFATAARFALQRMGGEAPLAAMREALAKATGDLRIGLANSLGERRDAKAIALIALPLAGEDAAAADAAVDALGKIGGPAAVEALLAAREKLPPAARTHLADALIRCAEGLLGEGKTAEAAKLYQDLSALRQAQDLPADRWPAHVRAAAFPGLLACRRQGAAEAIVAALKGEDRAMRQAAARAIRITGDKAVLEALAGQLPQVPLAVRPTVIEALAERRLRAAASAIAKEARGEDPQVRRAALAALGELGDAGSVRLLAELAASAEGGDQRIARASLVRLGGADVNEAMAKLLRTGPAPVRCELAAALAERGAADATPALLEAAKADDARVRTVAAKALGKLCGPDRCGDLIALLPAAAEDAERANLEAAIVATCRRAGQGDAAAAPVLKALPGQNAATAGSLLRILAALGGPKALAAARAAAKDKDAEVRTAAIRALAEWADDGPLEDLLEIAAAAKEPLPRVLALRGFAQLAGKSTALKPADLAALFARAMAIADRSDEKKALLAGLGGLRCVEALNAALAHLAEPALAEEAAAAAVRIADGLWRSRPAEAKAAMERIAAAKVGPNAQAEAARILVELSKPVNLAGDAKAASPDGLEKDGAAGGDQAAIDGDPATYWDEDNDQPLYRLVVTFPEPRTVAVLRITGFQHHAYAPKDFEVLCDGKVVKTVRGAVYQDNKLSVAVPATRCTAVELKITGYYGQSPAIRELEIFGPPPAGQAGKGAAQ